MSQHRLVLNSERCGAIEVLMGYDRPLAGFFMVVERAPAPGADPDDDPDYLYSNLADPALLASMGIAGDLEHFLAKLKEFDIEIPPEMQSEVLLDAQLNVGNRYCEYDANGPVREPDEPETPPAGDSMRG